MTDSSIVRSWLRYFIAGNAFLIGTLASLFAIDDVRTFLFFQISAAPALVIAVGASFEIVVALGASLFVSSPPTKGSAQSRDVSYSEEDPFLEGAFSRLVARFANPEDYEKLLAVYCQHFPSETILPAEEYRLLMRPERGFVRVLEGICANGIPKIIGFYSVWPLSRSMIDALASGGIKETAIRSVDILTFDHVEAATLYVAEIAIAKGQPFGQTLMRDARCYLLHRLAAHANLRSVSAWAYSDVGRKLASRMGMRRMIGRDGKGRDFFIAEIADIRRAILPGSEQGTTAPSFGFEATRFIEI